MSWTEAKGKRGQYVILNVSYVKCLHLYMDYNKYNYYYI